MKKIIAVIVSLIMMLSVSACAAGVQIGLDSVVLTENGEVVMQMADPGIRLAFAENESDVGLRVALEDGGQTALEAVITLGAENLLARVTGISDIYGLSAEQAIGMAESLVGSVPASLNIEPTEADMEIVNQIMAIVGEAASTGMYASEDGSTVGIKFTDEPVRKLLPLVAQLLENHPELAQSAGVTAEDFAAIQIPEDASFVIDAYLAMGASMVAALDIDVTYQGQTMSVLLSAETDMASFAKLVFDASQDAASIAGAEIVIGISETDGAWLIPADAEFIDVLTMSEEQMNTLMTEAQSILSMFGLA